MRIGMMTDTYKPYISGITNYIALNKRYLEAQGHEVYVFTFGGLGYQDNEKNIIRSPGVPLGETGFYLNVQYSPEARALLKTMDIVHVHHPFLSGILALRYCRPRGIPIIFTNHTRYDLYAQAYLPLLPEAISDTMLETYMPAFCDAVNMVISPSPGMEKILRQLQVKSHVEVIPNGVEMHHFREIKPLARTEFGFSDDDILLIYTGRLANEKNLEFLLQAFNGVAQAVPKTHLLLLGDGASKAKLIQNAQKSKAVEQIHFVGFIEYEKMPAYLAMCDAFVTASITEVHPLSVIEAMGIGLPIVGIESPGVGDSVTDGVSGFLSDHDLAEFTAKLTRLCLDAPLRQRMGAAAHAASQNYAIERTTASMLELYQKVISETHLHREERELRLRKILDRIFTHDET